MVASGDNGGSGVGKGREESYGLCGRDVELLSYGLWVEVT